MDFPDAEFTLMPFDEKKMTNRRVVEMQQSCRELASPALIEEFNAVARFSFRVLINSNVCFPREGRVVQKRHHAVENAFPAWQNLRKTVAERALQFDVQICGSVSKTVHIAPSTRFHAPKICRRDCRTVPPIACGPILPSQPGVPAEDTSFALTEACER